MKKNKDSEVKKEIGAILSNINKVAENSQYLNQIANEYQKARDLYHKELNDVKNAKKMQVIMDVLNFDIRDGQFIEMMSGTKDGKPWKYPNIDLFDENSFKIIESELKKAANNKLRARYADFLWMTKSDYVQARIAVDAYLAVISEYEESDKKYPDQHYGLNVLESFCRAFQIAKSIGYKVREVLQEFERLLFKFNSLSGAKAKVTIDLVELAISNKRNFKDKKFWKKVVDICEKQSEILMAENKQYFAREYLLNIKKIEQLIFQKMDKKWDNKVAESYVAEADAHKKGNNFAELSSLIKAIEEYKKLKNYRKVDELKRRYRKASSTAAFTEIGTKIDISDIVKDAKKRAKIIVKLSPEKIIQFLVINQNFYPTRDSIEKMVTEQLKKFVTPNIFGRIIFDQHMNQARTYSSDEERRYALILEQFDLGMSIYECQIHILMEEMVKKNLLHWKDIKNHFKKYSWFWMMFELKNSKGEVILKSKKIIDSIEPGVKQYIKAVNKFYKNKKIPYQEIILATDSLVMKIEGIIREMYQLLGKPTFIVRSEKGGKTITYEKDLNNYLNDDFIETIFGKDLVLLMKYLLVEQIGSNLRNNVGHCLIQKEHYNMLNLHLLFLILIRLGNYKFETANDNKKARD